MRSDAYRWQMPALFSLSLSCSRYIRRQYVPQLICLSAFVGASVVILVMRALIRKIGSQFGWWGYPVVLFGSGAVARLVLRKLKSQPHLGLRPVAVVADQIADREIEGIPVYKSEYLGRIASSGVRHAIVAAPELSQVGICRGDRTRRQMPFHI